MLKRKVLWRSLLTVALACLTHPLVTPAAHGHSVDADDSALRECQEALVEAQLRLARCTAHDFLRDTSSDARLSTSSLGDFDGRGSFEEEDAERKRNRWHGRPGARERRGAPRSARAPGLQKALRERTRRDPGRVRLG